MLLQEFFGPTQPGYNSENEDNSALKIGHSRKTKLTLAKLNRLRILNDVRKFERSMKIEKVKKQYAPAQDAGGGGMPGF